MRSRPRMSFRPRTCLWNSTLHFTRGTWSPAAIRGFATLSVHGSGALDANEISAVIEPDGSVDSMVAAGKVHASRSTPVGEDEVAAARVQMTLATRQNVPRLLTADGGVASGFA